MRKVIMGLGLVVGVVAWGFGMYGMVTTPDPYVVPVPTRLTVHGVFAMMGTLTLFVVVFAHGTRAGDLD